LNVDGGHKMEPNTEKKRCKTTSKERKRKANTSPRRAKLNPTRKEEGRRKGKT